MRPSRPTIGNHSKAAFSSIVKTAWISKDEGLAFIILKVSMHSHKPIAV
jgi:hypothetical protein